MKVALRKIEGPWDDGWVLDKHMAKSTFLGNDDSGRPQFDSLRTAVGEATYLLKYRRQWDQAKVLAQTLAATICPKLDQIGLIVPMPASNRRDRQPVHEVARELGRIIGVQVFEKLLLKKPNGKSLKDLATREEKLAALEGTMSIQNEISNSGQWNVLLLDDLYDSGASMEVATKVLRSYSKVRKIYVAALTWK